MQKESILKRSESALISKKIYVEKMLFERMEQNGNIIKFTNSDIEKSIEVIDEDVYKCSLILNMTDDNNEAYLQVTISGIFELKAEIQEDLKKMVIAKNTLAILFPYLRSQVTLLTAQPDVTPVVLPPININALLDNIKNDEN